MDLVSMQRLMWAVLLFAAVFAAGCTDKNSPLPEAKASPATAADVAPRSKVIGVEPAGPTREAAATASPAKSDITKTQQSTAMPMAGQANDHSTLSPQATQKSGPTGR